MGIGTRFFSIGYSVNIFMIKDHTALEDDNMGEVVDDAELDVVKSTTVHIE